MVKSGECLKTPGSWWLAPKHEKQPTFRGIPGLCYLLQNHSINPNFIIHTPGNSPFLKSVSLDNWLWPFVLLLQARRGPHQPDAGRRSPGPSERERSVWVFLKCDIMWNRTITVKSPTHINRHGFDLLCLFLKIHFKWSLISYVLRSM